MHQSHFEDNNWPLLIVDLVPVFKATISKGKETARLLHMIAII